MVLLLHSFFSGISFFFEVPWLRAATPDQELQLPESETYLISILEVGKTTLAKESVGSGNSIDGFAPRQVFRILLVLGAGFSLVFSTFRLVETARYRYTSLSFKVNWISGISYFGEFDLACLKKCEAVQTESWLFLSSWHTYCGRWRGAAGRGAFPT